MRKRIKFAEGVLSVVLGLFFVGLWGEARAVIEKQVVINEIMWDGVEYVELLNVTGDDILLDGWKVTRQQAGGESKMVVEFDEEDIIEAGDYYLLEKKEEATTAPADKVVSSLTLVNKGEQVTLVDAEGGMADQANRLGAWWAGENTNEGVAMERGVWDSDGTKEDSWHTSTGELNGRLGTPGAANSEPAANNPPAAAIGGESSGLAGEEMSWSGENSSDEDGDELEYDWLFGDSDSAWGVEVTHVYEEAGTYIVTLTVSDGELEDEAELSVTVTTLVYSNEIVINEFLPNPIGSDMTGEFIELKNVGNETVNIGGWRLDDEEGGSKPFTISNGESLEAGEVRSFGRTETKIALNNSGDTARLLDPAGEVRSSFSYSESVAEGQSYNRLEDGSYVLSTTNTPGEENVITEPAEENGEEDDDDVDVTGGKVAGAGVVRVMMKNIRSQELGAMVEVEGVVSVPPGVFGEKVMYLAGSGIQIYFYKEDYPEFALGDKVKVRGELTTSLGEYRIKLSDRTDIVVTGEAGAPLPHKVKTGEIDETLEGTLVMFAGGVVRTSGGTFYVDDGSGEIKVFIKKTTQINKPKMKKGGVVTIVGVVSRTNTGYRVLPRWQNDVRLGRVAGMTNFPIAGKNLAWVAVAALIWLKVVGQAYESREPLLKYFKIF